MTSHLLSNLFPNKPLPEPVDEFVVAGFDLCDHFWIGGDGRVEEAFDLAAVGWGWRVAKGERRKGSNFLSSMYIVGG